MITDVPTSQELHNQGVGYLNLAWGAIVDWLLVPFEGDPDGFLWGEEGFQEEYWGALEHELATAASVVLAGAELLLKARIAQVSPYLLIAGDPGRWPTAKQNANISFGDFRTLDASDLPRVHDTVAPQRLSQEFRGAYERARTRRNAALHGNPQRGELAPDGILTDLLEVSHELIGPCRWVGIRRDRVQKDPVAPFARSGYSEYLRDQRVPMELMAVAEFLPPKAVLRYLGIHKQQRFYVCPSCAAAIERNPHYGDGDRPALAQLRPSKPASTTLHCFVCEQDAAVIRQSCNAAGCRGNVITMDGGRCLTCYAEQ